MTFTLLASATEARQALLSLSDWADEIHIAVAWASTSKGSAAHWKGLDLSKIQRALVGTHFFQTEPHALEELAALDVLKVISEPTGVFHPKIFLGRAGSQVRALIGSSNLTTGGFALNSEVGVVIEAPEDHPEIARLLSLLDELWERKSAFVPDLAWMDWYREKYRRRPRPTPSAGPVPGKPSLVAGILDMEWSEFYAQLLAHEGRRSVHDEELRVFGEGRTYQAELRNCRRAFKASKTFADISQNDRALVGGFGGGTTGYLGHMGNAIQFRTLVAKHPEAIASALDALPVRGHVSDATIDQTVRALFAVSGVGLPSGTRLLSVKRPDLFFPVNEANLERVNETLLRLRKSVRHRADDYLAVLAAIRTTPWWNAPKPDSGPQRRAWKARTALLDVLLYSQ